MSEGSKRVPPVLVALAALALLAPSLAGAGGDFVDLTVAKGHVWFVGEVGVNELSATTGRTLWTIQLAGAPYPMSVAAAGGAVWVAGVQNGDVAGTLSRIDLRSRRVRVVWRVTAGAIQYLAAGGEGLWALASTSAATTIARFQADGHLGRTWTLPANDDGRMAADASGCWISTGGWLLHIDPGGHIHRVLAAPLGDVATGAGAVWLPEATSILRIDEATGRVHTLQTGPLRLGGFQHDLAVDDRALLALHQTDTQRSVLDRLDADTGRTTGTVALPGIADAVAAEPDGIWIAVVVARVGEPATGYDLIRVDSTTLRRTLLARVD